MRSSAEEEDQLGAEHTQTHTHTHTHTSTNTHTNIPHRTSHYATAAGNCRPLIPGAQLSEGLREM